jgi:hypothetical protein
MEDMVDFQDLCSDKYGNDFFYWFNFDIRYFSYVLGLVVDSQLQSLSWPANIHSQTELLISPRRDSCVYWSLNALKWLQVA